MTSAGTEPPAKRPCVECSPTDQLTIDHQLLTWNDLQKSINDQVEIVNQSNLRRIARSLFKDNLIRGRGILADAVIRAQIKSPIKTNVYAALVCIINKTFPEISLLICKRVIFLYRKSFLADDRKKTFITIQFLAHLINQKVLHEKISFEILDVLLHHISSDSVKLAIHFLKQCGQKLSQVNPQELDSQFSKLNNLLHGSLITQRTKDMITVLFTIRSNQFEAYPAIQSRLDLVDENDKHTHKLEYLHLCDPETILDEFKYDEEYEINQNKYEEISKTALDENSDDEDESSSNSLDNDNDQSNIPAADTDISSTGSSVADTSSTSSSVSDKEN